MVHGQRLTQMTSDIFLGWQQVDGVDGVRRDFYVRQLRDGKGSFVVEQMNPAALTFYGRLCGRTLARAHGRSGDRVAIAAYLGGSDAFDEAVADYSMQYAAQNQLDHAALRRGRRRGPGTRARGDLSRSSYAPNWPAARGPLERLPPKTVVPRPARCFNRPVHDRRTGPVVPPHSSAVTPAAVRGSWSSMVLAVEPGQSRENRVLWMQRTAGNHAAAGVLQHQPAPKTPIVAGRTSSAAGAVLHFTPAATAPVQPAVQRDLGAFGTVRDLSPKGSLPDSEWNVKTRTVPVTELYAEIAALAGADKIDGVTGTSKTSINPALRKDTDLKTGLNFVNNLASNGETGFVDSTGAYRGPKLPVDDAGLPTVAIILGPSAFAHDKAQALATMRHEMKHAEHFLLAIGCIETLAGRKEE